MHLTHLLPLLGVLAGFILALLSLLAGLNPSTLDTAYIVNLNTSRLGLLALPATPTTTSSNPAVSFLSSLKANVTTLITNDINSLIGSTTHKLGLRDYYSLHLLSFCSGYDIYPANASASAPPDPARNTTKCSAHAPGASLSASSLLAQDLAPGVTLDAIHWPRAIDDGLEALMALWSGAFALYVVGVAFAGLALLARVGAVLRGGRAGLVIAACVLCFLAFLGVGLASALVTALSVKGSDLVNREGAAVGISADRGNMLLAMTWSATALLMLAGIGWAIEGSRARRRTRVYGDEKY
ncbi:MAG: hypothetical protein M1829_000445 [Trizodia sp. TS-e1964]|nr:MAG: hypothetical protein M1829_000445 [Trizodia sp. TS-e1964]